jgi:hypothetical protein
VSATGTRHCVSESIRCLVPTRKATAFGTILPPRSWTPQRYRTTADATFEVLKHLADRGNITCNWYARAPAGFIRNLGVLNWSDVMCHKVDSPLLFQGDCQRTT